MSISRKYRIFVINLDRSPDRLARVEKDFESKSVEFERFAAVDGRLLSDSELNEYYDCEFNKRKYFAPLSVPEIACYMSHLKLCGQIAESDLDYAVVLEDDVVLSEKFRMLPQILDSIKTPWNYIKLISPGREKPIKSSVALTGEFGEFKLVKWRKPPVGTAAYVITPKGAREFISKRRKFYRPIDVDLQYEWESDLNVLGIVPSLVGLSEDKSTIQGAKQLRHYRGARIIYKIKLFFLSVLHSMR